MTIYKLTWQVVQLDGGILATVAGNQSNFSTFKNFSTKEKALEYQKSLVDAATLLGITYLFRTALHEEVID